MEIGFINEWLAENGTDIIGRREPRPTSYSHTLAIPHLRARIYNTHNTRLSYIGVPTYSHAHTGILTIIKFRSLNTDL